MKSDEIATKLDQLQEKQSNLVIQMDAIYERLKEAMPSAAAKWAEDEVIEKIKVHYEKTSSMSKEQLHDLRTKLNTLIASFPDMVIKEFGDKDKWSHHIEWKGNTSSTIFDINQIHEFFKNVISPLGEILASFGIVDDLNNNRVSWRKGYMNGYKYIGEIDWECLPIELSAAYVKLFREYAKSCGDIRRASEEYGEAKAAELWEEI